MPTVKPLKAKDSPLALSTRALTSKPRGGLVPTVKKAAPKKTKKK